MAHYKQHFFDAPDLQGSGTHRIGYLEWREGLPRKTVVCVHGLTRNAHDFDFLAAELKTDYRVISIDMAGRGASDSLSDTSQYNYVSYMSDCLALIAYLKLGPVDWVGTSMGGLIGMMIAALQPHVIHKMVMNDIGMIVPKVGLERIVDYVKKTPESFISEEAVQHYLRKVFAPFGISDEAHWQHVFAHSIVKSGDDYAVNYDLHIIDPVLEQTNGGKDIQDTDLSELWEKVQTPTLLLRGAQSDILPQEVAYAMLEQNENAEMVEIEGVGHAPALLSAQQVSLVAEWLRAN